MFVVTPFNALVDYYNHSLSSFIRKRNNGVINDSNVFKISTGYGSNFDFNSDESILKSPQQDSNGISFWNVSFYKLRTANAY